MVNLCHTLGKTNGVCVYRAVQKLLATQSLHHDHEVFELVGVHQQTSPKNNSKIRRSGSYAAFNCLFLQILTRLRLKASGSSASRLIFSSCVFIMVVSNLRARISDGSLC